MALRARRVVGLAAVLVAVLGGGAVWLGPYLFEGNEYEHVQSIEQRLDYRDSALIEAAWQLPVAARYRQKPYEFQSNPSFCAPTSAANVLRSLGTDMTQKQVIDGTEYDPWFGILLGGLTLDQLADLIRKRTDKPVAIVRPANAAEFRALLGQANDPGVRFIVNFHRGPLFGRGHGHFSPILGYLADQDLAFVGDVNRDYQPFLVRSSRLWSAVDTLDSTAGKQRGLLVIGTAASSTAGTSQ